MSMGEEKPWKEGGTRGVRKKSRFDADRTLKERQRSILPGVPSRFPEGAGHDDGGASTISDHK